MRRGSYGALLGTAISLASCSGSGLEKISSSQSGLDPEAERILERFRTYDPPYKGPDRARSVREAYEHHMIWKRLGYPIGVIPSAHYPRNYLFKFSVEDELLALGSRAVPSILRFLEGEESERIKRRLLELIGQFKDPRAIPLLLRFAGRKEHVGFAIGAITGLGHLGNKQALQGIGNLFGKSKAPMLYLIWAAGRSGDVGARDAYYDWMARSIGARLKREGRTPEGINQDERERDRPRKEKTVGRITLPRPDKEVIPPKLEDDLHWYLVLLSEFQHPRSVGLLIECLRHEEESLPHVALFLLHQRIAKMDRPKEPKGDMGNVFECEPLHEGQMYQAWRKWWDENKLCLVWIEQDKRFSVRKP